MCILDLIVLRGKRQVLWGQAAVLRCGGGCTAHLILPACLVGHQPVIRGTARRAAPRRAGPWLVVARRGEARQAVPDAK